MTIKKISIVHPYIEQRLQEIKQRIYPKHHLWGFDQFEKEKSLKMNLLQTEKTFCPTILEKTLNKLFFKNSPGIKAEISAWKESRTSELIYSVCGPLALSQFYKKTKVISWVFRHPNNRVNSLLDPYSQKNLQSNDALLCLTPDAEKHFSKLVRSKFIPWCIDMEMFDGKPPINKPEKPFFLASGKTQRDYNTLVNAAHRTTIDIRIIGPKNLKPLSCPNNVHWIDTSIDPPDQAIDYPTLKEWYAQCAGVCIPLTGDATDTCGYTNMLEGMAMRKPILMSRSGCLHINPQSRNFGILIEPQDSRGWSDSMNRIIGEPAFAEKCGESGRKIAENEFTIDRFNRNVLSFISDALKT